MRLHRRTVESAVASALLVVSLPAAFIVTFSAERVYAVLAILAVPCLMAVAAYLLWSQIPFWQRIRRLASSAGATVMTALVVGPVSYGIGVTVDLCGNTTDTIGYTSDGIAALAYVSVGVWGLRKPSRALWAWPLALVLAVSVQLAAAAILPGGSGKCET